MALTRLGPNQAVNLSTNTTGNLNLTSQVTGALPVANGGTALTSGFVNGSANSVVQFKKMEYNTQQCTTSTSYQDSGLTLDFTPLTADSYHYWTFQTAGEDGNEGGIRIQFVLDGVSKRAWTRWIDNTNIFTPAPFTVIDTSSTSQYTMKIQFASYGGDSVCFNANNSYSILTVVEYKGSF